MEWQKGRARNLSTKEAASKSQHSMLSCGLCTDTSSVHDLLAGEGPQLVGHLTERIFDSISATLELLQLLLLRNVYQ